ncbi:hypothetical protein [Paenibacillus agilis]|uniref:Uncharacterized protein n=1 Tax=Paenibacillus agilis TaxID=3020863 RepID=A0A559J0D3_9BACL|nr:hypothetical protein [Paenibacillus agilis]TVX93344.1 hypothetical protein FPZ44_09925 [Paenibacillus agilis]
MKFKKMLALLLVTSSLTLMSGLTHAQSSAVNAPVHNKTIEQDINPFYTTLLAFSHNHLLASVDTIHGGTFYVPHRTTVILITDQNVVTPSDYAAHVYYAIHDSNGNRVWDSFLTGNKEHRVYITLNPGYYNLYYKSGNWNVPTRLFGRIVD